VTMNEAEAFPTYMFCKTKFQNCTSFILNNIFLYLLPLYCPFMPTYYVLLLPFPVLHLYMCFMLRRFILLVWGN